MIPVKDDGTRTARRTRVARKRLPAIATRHTWVFAAGLVVVLLIANATVQRSILEPSYWPTLLGTLAPFVLVALASTVPILAGGGGIDISVGPTATLTNCLLAAVLFANGWTSIWVTLPIVLVVGVAIGVLNGVLVVFGRLQPVIATLATFFVLSGIALKISPNPVPATGNWTSKLSGMVGPVPGALITIGAALVVWLVLWRLRYVSTLKSVGGDDVAAFSAGVPVAKVRIGAYALAGLFAAIAGIALTAVIQTSAPSLATTYSLVALAAVSLGGTSLLGGIGGMLGSVLGASAIYLLQELLAGAGVPTSYVQFVYGLLLVAGVVLSGLATRKR
ncbi:ABC transporter permease [Georgenia thermotolerans]|nr:ABC transporter permease [Georgenia thermotolerans]